MGAGLYGLALLSVLPGVSPVPGLAGLPVIELPVGNPCRTMAVILSGDGGWAAGDKGMAKALNDAGIPVAGFVTPSYLQVPRTPDGAAKDLGRLLDHYFTTWGCERVLVIGYSRGADTAPFMVSRLPPAMRRRVASVTLIGLGVMASFQYRPTDLFADALRYDDYPVGPEVAKLKGITVLCISGERERGSLCRSLDSGTTHRATHAGGHRLSRESGGKVAALILEMAPPGMASTSSPSP